MARFKKLGVALALSPAAVFAEGETTSSPLNTVIQNVQTGLTDMIAVIVPAIGAIVVAGLVFWGLRALVRWARSYFGK